MAVLTGPGMSLDASGKFAGAMVFSKWKGRNVLRQLVTPANPQSVAQTSTRAMFEFLSKAWAGLSAAQQATWQTLADARVVSPFNAYVKFDMELWTQFLTPKKTTVIAAGTVPVLGTLTVTGGVGQLDISQVITTANQGWGLLVSISTTTGYTPGKLNTESVFQWSATPIAGVLTQLAPGTYFVRTSGFTDGGVKSAYVAEVSAVVT
jgi:hypothetical protein